MRTNLTLRQADRLHQGFQRIKLQGTQPETLGDNSDHLLIFRRVCRSIFIQILILIPFQFLDNLTRDETSALLQYKDIKGKLLLEKQADRKKTPESLEEVPKLCSSLREAVAAYEEKLIWQALEAAHGNISEAARILDVPRQTLQRKASQLRGEKAKEKQEKEI